jgi:hypothetical protein
MSMQNYISPRSARRPQRGEAATESRIISRKDAKAAKKKKKYLSELSVLGALAGEMSESEMFRTLEDLPKPAQIFKHSSTKDSEIITFQFLTSCSPRSSWLSVCLDFDCASAVKSVSGDPDGPPWDYKKEKESARY